jgi:hypothetical protein
MQYVTQREERERLRDDQFNRLVRMFEGEEPVQIQPLNTTNKHNTTKTCKETNCAVCFESINNDNYVHLNCNHEFCGMCVDNIVSNYAPTCPLCRAVITDVYSHVKV